ncbi:pilus assembly protein PilM [Patulibacter defluvii]|uniref:pilus assembly protein PilM n=1 Tax=Patulibacter defluvii TaxID=3095358 RepID=UPI002A749143|nr:pilus assembly protein PilM [Patulibacter sp. DM4]
MPRRQLTLPRLPSRPAPRRPSASAPVTGVRIGATHVGLACAAAPRGPLTARASASAVLPPGAVRDGEVVDAIAVAQALRQAVEGRNGFGKQVRLGVGCQKVAVRVLDLPPVQNEDDLEAAVRMLARERIPTAADDALIDYRMLTDLPGADGEPPVRRALVVAARRELVDGQIAAVKAAGLEPVGVDLLAFGLARMVQPSEPTMLLDLDGVTTLALADPDGCQFVRTIPAGVQSAAEDLARRAGLEVEDAAGGLLGDQALDPEATTEARAVVARTIRAIATTVRTSVEFHVEQEDGAAPQLCVVSGPLAGLEGVSALLSEALDLPVHPAAALAGGADPVALGLSVEES